MSGFGYEKEKSANYHFELGFTNNGNAHLIEVMAGSGSSNQRRPKATISRAHWAEISQVVTADFNHRLRRASQAPGKWNKVTTKLAPHFGKELVLLAWAVEGQSLMQLSRIALNWRGLAPEERWWFYTTINATSTNPNAETGWLAGFRLAMLDSPRESPVHMLESMPEIDHQTYIAVEPEPGDTAGVEPGNSAAILQGRLFAEPDTASYTKTVTKDTDN